MTIKNVMHQLPWAGSNGKLNKSTLKYLIVHHEGVATPLMYNTVKRIQKDAYYHISKGWNHISYHYMMDNTGDIFQCLPDDEIGYHAGDLSVNKNSIAICVQGNYETQYPNFRQKRALKEFCDYMFGSRPDLPKLVRSGLKTHKEVRPRGTSCPGLNLIPVVIDIRK